MAKENKKPEVAEAETNDQLIIGGKTMSIEEICAEVSKKQIGAKLTSKMWTLEPGDEAKVVFISMTKISGLGDKKGQLVDAARLLNVDEGEVVTCGDVVAVSFFRGAQPMDSFNVVCVGKKGPAGQQYKDLEIYALV